LSARLSISLWQRRGTSRTVKVALLLSALCLPVAVAGKDDQPSRYLPTPPVAYPQGVKSFRDVTYAELSGFRPLTLDLYVPPRGAVPKPLIVFVHGGAWLHLTSRDGGGFHDFPATLAALAARGYVIASVNYRNSGEAPFPGAVQDVERAIHWLRGHAARYGLDPARVVLWGSSAGGQIATVIGTGCDAPAIALPASDPANAGTSSCVQGVIDWYGLIDLAANQADLGPPVNAKAVAYMNAYLGCDMARCPAGWVRSTNPISYIDPSDPPFLIAHGTADTTVSPKQSQRLYDALRASGVPAELVLVPGVAHGFAKPGGGSDEAANRAALAKVLAYLGRYFPSHPK
jgi:acetyl esterase/lipase